MTTLISVHNSDGCVGRCDAKCHVAKGSVCRCICGGLAHGAGVKNASAAIWQKIGQVDGSVDRLLETWSTAHPEHAGKGLKCAVWPRLLI
jgi:hypothetical protein